MFNMVRLQAGGNSPRVSAVQDGAAIVVRIEAPPAVAPADELRPIALLAETWGLERHGLERVIRQHRISTIKIGRQRCVRRSDVLAILGAPAARNAPPSGRNAIEDDYAAVVARAGRRT
jgi:hypothetical protein